ncbi:MAG: hypothetical protein V7K48_15865 [Nostoc sp.]|uniref:hypothetical protein n=1 Tax=Nostoc sp. TaxID=1180 RepID=UPI002FF9F430
MSLFVCCDRLAENFKNKAIACCRKVSAIALRTFPKAIALQKSSKIMLSLLWKSECDRLAEILKNKA